MIQFFRDLKEVIAGLNELIDKLNTTGINLNINVVVNNTGETSEVRS